ncbi:MAG: hypothetical protein ACFB14_20830 [Leptolyngbyaceae cyanobacterium]
MTTASQSDDQQRPPSAPELDAEAIKPWGNRNFVVPGCSTEITATQGKKTIEDLLSLVFAIASSNPGIQVDFWIGIPDPYADS